MSRINTFRHPLHSLFQSMVEEVANKIEDRVGKMTANQPDAPRLDENHPATAVAHAISRHKSKGKEVPDQPPAELSAKHGGVVDTLWTCAKLAGEYMEAKFLGNDKKAAEKKDELKFNTCDPEWLEAVMQYEEYFGLSGDRRDIPYVRWQNLDDFVMETLPADAKVALLGDWGTGTDEAIALLKAVKKHEPDVIIHLGDVYYSGTENETHKFFLDILNDVLERDKNPIPVYNMTGNHDMYSGGAGFYKLLPQTNPPPLFNEEQAQKASYFCLRSVDGAWQFLAMDTGLHDHDPFTVSTDITYLEDSEVEWHVDKIRRHSQAGGRTILLSHHQLFSAFDAIGKGVEKPAGQEAANPKLLESFRQFQEAAEGPGDIAAWFWGHEHNLDIYEPYLGLAKGRCMGHAAVPHFKEDNPYQVLDGIPDPPQLVDDPALPGEKLKLGTVDEIYAHGFAIIKLDDRDQTATVGYFQETNAYASPMYEEKL